LTIGQLFAATRPDFAPIYREIAVLPDIATEAVLPEDRSYAGFAAQRRNAVSAAELGGSLEDVRQNPSKE
jgi:hypothetical protein